jgi:hypothetical protein
MMAVSERPIPGVARPSAGAVQNTLGNIASPFDLV